MIGMIIVGILLAIGIPAFSGWIQNARIRTTAESIQNGLQLARVEAVRNNTLVQFSRGAGTSSDWTIGCTTPVDRDGDGVFECPAVIQSRSAAEGSTNVNISATADVVVFNGLGRVTPAGTPANNIDIPSDGVCAGGAATAGLNRCLRIMVSPGGQIRMCDRSASTTAVPPDPRACL
jgi:type IV fimbrial biogenesis protein FimT